jgi:hypothetical protein
MATGSLGQRGRQATSDFVLDRSVTIVVSSDEPGPVRLAAEDLAGDFAKVLGTRPNIVARVEDAGQKAIVVGELGNLSSASCPKGLSAPESFSIAAACALAANTRSCCAGLTCAAPSMRFISFPRSIWGSIRCITGPSPFQRAICVRDASSLCPSAFVAAFP